MLFIAPSFDCTLKPLMRTLPFPPFLSPVSGIVTQPSEVPNTRTFSPIGLQLFLIIFLDRLDIIKRNILLHTYLFPLRQILTQTIMTGAYPNTLLRIAEDKCRIGINQLLRLIDIKMFYLICLWVEHGHFQPFHYDKNLTIIELNQAAFVPIHILIYQNGVTLVATKIT